MTVRRRVCDGGEVCKADYAVYVNGISPERLDSLGNIGDIYGVDSLHLGVYLLTFH